MKKLGSEKFNPVSTNSIIIQIIIGFIFFIGFLVNLFFNWDYFDEYSGSNDFGYYLAFTISDIAGYGFIVIAITIIISLYLFIRKNRKALRTLNNKT